MKMYELVKASEAKKGKEIELTLRVPSWLERKTKAALSGTVKAKYNGKLTRKKGSRSVAVPVTVKGETYKVRLQDLQLA